MLVPGMDRDGQSTLCFPVEEKKREREEELMCICSTVFPSVLQMHPQDGKEGVKVGGVWAESARSTFNWLLKVIGGHRNATESSEIEIVFV